MTQDNDTTETKDRSLGLSTAQVAGSALAAMSGAFFVSWAGTAGTLIGAAAGSVIATVGAATYTWSLRRTSDAAKRTAVAVKQRTLVTGAMPRTVAQGPLSEDGNTRRDAPIEEDQPPSAVEEPDPDQQGGSASRWNLPWGKVLLASLAVMIAGMAGITAVEAVTGKPIGSFFGRDDGTGTTVGHVVSGDSKSSNDEKAPTEKTPKPEQQQPSSKPSAQPQEQEPTTQPDPTTAPTPEPPVESQVPDTGTDTGQ